MKKALAMALGAMLVAGAAAPAFAASQIDFKGYYRIHQMNNWNQTFESVDDNKSSDDFYFINRLNMEFTFNATDDVAVYWRFWAPGAARWGDGRGTVATKWAYGEAKTDAGTFSIGHLSDNFQCIGLADLGHSLTAVADGGIWGSASPFDWDADMDGARWAKAWDNGFQLVAQFTRASTEAKLQHSLEMGNTDLYILEPAYLWDGGGATLALIYQNDHASGGPTYAKNKTAWDNKGAGPADVPAAKSYFINPAVSHSFGDYTVNFEGKAGWGSQDESWEKDTESIKETGYAFYLDFDYNYGPGNVTLAGWWASGSTDEDMSASGNPKFKGLVDMGSFAPFLVAYGGLANNGWDRASTVRNAAGDDPVTAISVANEINSFSGNGNANHWVLALTGAHAFTDDVTLKYGLGYLSLNKVDKFKFDSSGNPTTAKAKKDIGYEADLGVDVQLLDSLKFTSGFGYLVAGKALETVDASGKKSKEDAYNWYNTLTFSF